MTWGGGRSLSLGACLVVACYVAADRYVETVEEKFRELDRRLTAVEAASHQGEARDRFEGADVERRLERLERRDER